MRYILLAASLLLAAVGSSGAVIGIMAESFKLVAIGMVLLLTAGVPATLFLGTRRPVT